MNKKDIYEEKALQYSERYGITTYKVISNKMI